MNRFVFALLCTMLFLGWVGDAQFTLGFMVGVALALLIDLLNTPYPIKPSRHTKIETQWFDL